MKHTFRSKCPITSALDLLGDKWSLVVIKQMLFEGKSTFKDFVESQEAIATNILSSRLKMLEDYGMLDKQKLPDNKKTNVYTLTDKGIALTPVLLELTIWSKYHVEALNPNLNLDKDLEWAEQHKAEAIENIINNYKQFKNTLINPSI